MRTHRTLFGRIVAPLVASVLLGSLALCAVAGRKDGTLDLYWIDSEGGGSTLLVTPEDESVLIDSGNPGGRDAKRILHVARDVAGLTRIDYLVTTHFHIDHFGGAAELSQEIPIGTVYDNGIPDRNPDNNPSDTRFPLMIKPYREMKAAHRATVEPGALIPLRQGARHTPLLVRFLGGKQRFSDAPAAAKSAADCTAAVSMPKDTSDNANSVVTLVQFGGFRYLNCGDLTWNTEAELVCPQNRIGTVDVFQVNHHGLDVSNNPLLLQAIAPTVSVMNNGPRKGGAQKTFNTLKSIPSIQAMYQVHRNVQTGLDGNTTAARTANSEEKCQGEHIHLSVAPDGHAYTVTVPSTGHHQTFRCQHRQEATD